MGEYFQNHKGKLTHRTTSHPIEYEQCLNVQSTLMIFNFLCMRKDVVLVLLKHCILGMVKPV